MCHGEGRLQVDSGEVGVMPIAYFFMLIGLFGGVLLWRSSYRRWAIPFVATFAGPPIAAAVWVWLAFGGSI